MELPGGLVIAGQRRRDFRFVPLTGALELALADSARLAVSHSRRVTQVLCAALAMLGGEAPDAGRVRNLCVGDRQFLMRQLSALLAPGTRWQTVRCSGCGALFEISYRHGQLPVKPAGAGFPAVVVDTSLGAVRVRVPSGADQEAVEDIADEALASARLLARLVEREDGSAFALERLPLPERERLEQVIEDLSPEIATHSESVCPECGAANPVGISPYACLQHSMGDLFQDLHTLALHYHWSEEAILALPQERRRIYLTLIDRSRNMFGTEAGLQPVS